ncbi:short-chain dehydrogenase TIC 32, chloroplastic-like [Vigna radiata var. radiata]|uniref:Short-chain dehydrogenase TIC 32, chloroplastic-like n=1 Tax=Vigna radiata var. radiata TaxID=3916 RepID=A0A3Q0EZB9_VIGRR|nr:short-chain dehydrogenase TIC 32, chloroplastic-like [Vigna radiata var. radiata]
MRGVHVIMGVRNLVTAKDVKEGMLKEIPTAKLDYMELDLSSMASVRKFASNFISSALPLNILINNAGIYGTPFTLSEDNIELQFATNHIGHFLLTNLLLDTMKKTTHESMREGRIINVTSCAYRLSYRGGIRFDKINDESSYSKFCAYAQSKLANILHANELARRLKEDGVDITANSVHPGAIITNIHRYYFHSGLAAVLKKLIGFAFKNVERGASTTCYVALHPEVRGISGEYFADNKMAKVGSKGRDIELAKKLWNFSLNLIN